MSDIDQSLIGSSAGTTGRMKVIQLEEDIETTALVPTYDTYLETDFETGGGDILVEVDCIIVQVTGFVGTYTLQVRVDGGSPTNLGGASTIVAINASFSTKALLTGISAGVHTVTIEWSRPTAATTAIRTIPESADSHFATLKLTEV